MDESKRDRRYLLCAAIVEPIHVRTLRKQLTDLLKMGAHRLVIDTRAERDRFDGKTIREQLHDQPAHSSFSYAHNDSGSEPLCWIADAAAWCFGAGGDWRRRIMPMIDDVIEL
ncbi:MAG TPA: hypothetical protein VGM75_21730 [Pseudonocardiaceae bacterium]